MKKAFIQKLSIAMASALVITAAAPATADAAASMALNKKSKVLYLNQDNMTNTADSFDFNIKNKGANYKSKYKFKWTVSNSNAKVDQKGVVTAKKVGKTTVKCTVTKKSTGKVYKTLSATVEVKANAETVAINNAPENNQIAVGTSFDFNRTMKAANGGKATDKTEWFLTSDAKGEEALDASIATVDSKGVVTALQAGEFYVFAKTYQSKATKEQGYTAVSEGVKVTAPLEMTDVKLTKVDTVELAFNSSVKDVVKKGNVRIETVGNNKVVYPVKDVTVSEDGKTVTVVSYEKFKNDTTYTITADKTSKEFKAVVGEIASIVIKDQTVAPINNDASKAQDLKYTVLDANGVDVTDNYAITGTAMSVISSNANGSYVGSDGKMYMNNKGDVVSVQLKWTKYSNTGVDESITSNVATITATEASATNVKKWTIGDANKAADFSKNVTTINVNQTNKKLFAKLVDSYNTEVDPDSYQSLDESILVVANDGTMKALKAGTVVVKLTKGNYAGYVTVTVNPEATFKCVTADKVMVKLSNTNKLTDTQTVTLTLKDSYDQKLVANKTGRIQTTSNYSDFLTISSETTVNFVDGEATFTLTPVAGKTGNAYFVVDVEGKQVYINVQVVAPQGATRYAIELSNKEVDNYPNNAAGTPAETTVTVFNADVNGVKVSAATGNNITWSVKDTKGNVVINKNKQALTGELKDTNSFVINSINEGLAAGQYTIEVKSGPISATEILTVKSTKKSAAAVVNTTKVKCLGGDLNTALANAVTFKVDGVNVTPSSVDFTQDIFYSSPSVISNGTVTWIETEQSTVTSGRVYVSKVVFTVNGESYEAPIAQSFDVSKY